MRLIVQGYTILLSGKVLAELVPAFLLIIIVASAGGTKVFPIQRPFGLSAMGLKS